MKIKTIYKIIYESNWYRPQVFYAHNKKELKNLIFQGESQQYRVCVFRWVIDGSIFSEEGGYVKESILNNSEIRRII